MIKEVSEKGKIEELVSKEVRLRKLHRETENIETFTRNKIEVSKE